MSEFEISNDYLFVSSSEMIDEIVSDESPNFNLGDLEQIEKNQTKSNNNLMLGFFGNEVHRKD